MSDATGLKIILGSASKGRRGVLEKMGYDFSVMSADIDEKAIRHDDPKVLTLILARAKAAALLPKIDEPAILITADQVGCWRGEIVEKPADADEARRYLRGYGETPLDTVAGIVVTNTATGKKAEGVDVVRITFAPIPDSLIEEFIMEGDIFSRAGGFSIEEPRLVPYIKSIEGEIESVIGLPRAMTERLIREVL